jgi:ribosome-binding protein aMBF1 (putative translation factor)
MSDGKFIKSSHIDAHCEACGKITEHARNEFEKAIYYICQTCAAATVARKEKNEKGNHPPKAE